jgi:hypothetical protein
MPLLSTDQLAIERAGVVYRAAAGDLANLAPPAPTIGVVTVAGPSGAVTQGAAVTLTASYSGDATDVVWSWSGPAGTDAPVATAKTNVLSWNSGIVGVGVFTATATSATASDSPQSGSYELTTSTPQIPIYISQSTANSSTGTRPSNTNKDLIVMIAFSTTSTPPTVPPGWTTAFQSNDAGEGLTIAWHISTGTGTPAVGNWVGATSTTILVYRNTDKAKPLGAIAVDYSAVVASAASAPLLDFEDKSGASACVSGLIGQAGGTYSGTPADYIGIYDGSRISVGRKLNTANSPPPYTKQHNATQAWRGFSFEVLKPGLAADPEPAPLPQWYVLALDYLARVESYDGEPLESELRDSVVQLFQELDADGQLMALEVACLLAGPRTIDGALEPLIGTTMVRNFGFVEGNLARTVGLHNDGGKYLEFDHSVPLLDAHLSVYRQTSGVAYELVAMAGQGNGSTKLGDVLVLHGPAGYSGRFEGVCSSDVSRGSNNLCGTGGTLPGFYGVARNATAVQDVWNPEFKKQVNQPTVGGTRPTKMTIFRYAGATTVFKQSKDRLKWFSHGRYVDGTKVGKALKRHLDFVETFLAA